MKQLPMLALAGMIAMGQAEAGCGAAFCSASNDWLTLTQGVTPGWRIWGQMEYLNQNQLREGTDKVSRAEITEHHEEIKTINRNFLLGMDYGFAQDWSVGVVVPYSNREHSHVHNHHGIPYHDSWQFDELGDVRLKLRYQPGGTHASDVMWSLNGGVKLPTGKTDVRNSDGDEAERSVQPGTGTTDLLLGGGLAYAPLAMPGTLFANLSVQLPLNEEDGYEPGWRAALQAGWQYPVTGKLDLLLQANLLRVGQDDGANAEPEESGRTEVAIVPGLSYAWSKDLTAYAQLELPVYQDMKGVQLTHDYAVSAGFSLTLD
jgi:predicted porin